METRIRDRAPADATLSGLYILPTGLDAYAARHLLADQAEATLDLQTYILHWDTTGKLLLGRLLAAADRGVRVRMLVDDLSAPECENALAALEVHPRVEVRFFNPFPRGRGPKMLWRALGYLLHPARLNRRMHNKTFAVDGTAVIVGGRNIGDEYFDAGERVNFADLDLIGVGPVAGEVGKSFEAYWSHALAAPLARWPVLRRAESELARLRDELARHDAACSATPYAERVRGSGIVRDLLTGKLELVWAPVRACADRPEKITAAAGKVAELSLGRFVDPVARAVREDLVVVSPYFVPGREGLDYFRELRARGVRVRVLTNSLAATDVGIVHAGYARYRRRLLELGVELWELQPRATPVTPDEGHGVFGSSGASLHAKTFVFDRRQVFVGSLNLDPRSRKLNTEQGMLVDDPGLAERVLALFERGIQPRDAFRVALDSGGRIAWHAEVEGSPASFTTEPYTSAWRRAGVWLGSLLPIEGQL